MDAEMVRGRRRRRPGPGRGGRAHRLVGSRERRRRDPAAERPEAEAIDLLEAAGGAVAKRVVPVLGIALLLAILVTVIRRRR